MQGSKIFRWLCMTSRGFTPTAPLCCIRQHWEVAKGLFFLTKLDAFGASQMSKTGTAFTESEIHRTFYGTPNSQAGRQATQEVPSRNAMPLKFESTNTNSSTHKGKSMKKRFTDKASAYGIRYHQTFVFNTFCNNIFEQRTFSGWT